MYTATRDHLCAPSKACNDHGPRRRVVLPVIDTGVGPSTAPLTVRRGERRRALLAAPSLKPIKSRSLRARVPTHGHFVEWQK